MACGLALASVGADGIPRLWVRALDSREARALPGTAGAQAPFWSPDGRNIGFFAGGQLKRISAQGGRIQTLAETATSVAFGGSWGDDDVILFSPGLGRPLARTQRARRRDQTGGDHRREQPLRAISVPHSSRRPHTSCSSTSEPRTWATFTSARSMHRTPRGWPRRNPPPSTYHPATFYTRAPGRSLRNDSMQSAARSPATRSRSHKPRASSRSPRRTMELSVFRDTAANSQLVWVDRQGIRTGAAGPPANYENWALSPDDRRVAFDAASDTGADIWILDIERQITSRLTTQPPMNNVPIWSPRATGSRSRRCAMVRSTFRRAATGAGEDELVSKVAGQPIVFPSDWSRDGTMLAYYRMIDGTNIDTWIQPLEAGRDPFPYLDSRFDESQGQFSPDGKWSAYVSDQSGQRQVYVTSFPSPAGREQVSVTSGTQPRWSRDGRELFYLSGDGKLMAVTVRAGETFAADTPQALFDSALDPNELRQTYAVSADGERFLLQAPAEGFASALTVVLNWPALLER